MRVHRSPPIVPINRIGPRSIDSAPPEGAGYQGAAAASIRGCPRCVSFLGAGLELFSKLTRMGRSGTATLKHAFDIILLHHLQRSRLPICVRPGWVPGTATHRQYESALHQFNETRRQKCRRRIFQFS